MFRTHTGTIWSRNYNSFASRASPRSKTTACPTVPIADQEKIGKTLGRFENDDGRLCGHEGLRQSDLRRRHLEAGNARADSQRHPQRGGDRQTRQRQMVYGRARMPRRATGLGIPDGQRDRYVPTLRRDLREGRAGDGDGAAQHATRSSEALPDQDRPGVSDLPRASTAPRSRSFTICIISRSPKETSSRISIWRGKRPRISRSATIRAGRSRRRAR